MQNVYVLCLPSLSTSNVDAISGNDYTAIVNRQITFNPMNTIPQTVTVTINDERIVENDERFTATLTAVDGVNVSPSGATTTVTIVDDDSTYI